MGIKVKVNCAYCNVEFEINQKPSTNMNHKFYCCQEHYYLGKRKTVKNNCKQCGIEYESLCKEVYKFCGVDCENEYSLTHEYSIKSCKHCGKEFKIFKGINYNQHFCSRDCKVDFNKIKKTKTITCEICSGLKSKV